LPWTRVIEELAFRSWLAIVPERFCNKTPFNPVLILLLLMFAPRTLATKDSVTRCAADDVKSRHLFSELVVPHQRDDVVTNTVKQDRVGSRLWTLAGLPRTFGRFAVSNV